MTCEHISTPTGPAIVCGRYQRRRCACGRDATLLCDWKVPGKKSGTCDKPVCTACATSPAPDKDLCRDHADAYRVWLSERRSRSASA